MVYPRRTNTQLIEAMRETRARTLELVDDLSEAQLMGPRLQIVNPLRWEIGHVAADLWLWKDTSRYASPDDWVFASPRRKGKRPLRPEGVLSKIIRPAAVYAGIKKRIGWHTFRHTYSSTLIANGENVKVVQELMRHASSRFTLEVYTQAKARAKRGAPKSCGNDPAGRRASF